MTRPLRSAPITGASPLLRAGPPARTATGAEPPLAAAGYPRVTCGGRVGARLLLFRSGAAGQGHVASMPDTAWPVSGYLSGSSRNTKQCPVLMSSVFVSTRQQRFACARLPDHYLTPHRVPFPRSLTTTVFS